MKKKTHPNPTLDFHAPDYRHQSPSPAGLGLLPPSVTPTSRTAEASAHSLLVRARQLMLKEPKSGQKMVRQWGFDPLTFHPVRRLNTYHCTNLSSIARACTFLHCTSRDLGLAGPRHQPAARAALVRESSQWDPLSASEGAQHRSSSGEFIKLK